MHLRRVACVVSVCMPMPVRVGASVMPVKLDDTWVRGRAVGHFHKDSGTDRGRLEWY
jgi:hypothetical protein